MKKTSALLALATAGALLMAPTTAFAANSKPYTCDHRRATIVSSAEVITGTSRSDVIVVLGTGPHTVNAGNGNDRICGSSGADTINAGNGNDRVFAGLGADTVTGGAGNDRISGGGTGDVLSGDAGNDVLSGDAGNDLISGGAGADSIDGGLGNDDLDGNDGTDEVTGGDGTDVKHLDSRDRNGDPRGQDTEGDDSEHRAVPAALADALRTAGAYLSAGIAAGDITGSGFQTSLPAAARVGTAPVSDLIRDVTWDVKVNQEHTVVRGCLDGTVDGTTFFKFRLEPREGWRDRARTPNGKPRPRPVTTGKCESNWQPAAAPTAVNDALSAAAGYLGAAMLAGRITGTGTQAVVPDDGLTPAPVSPVITLVLWRVEAAQSGQDDPVKARMCLSAFVDGQSFRYAAETRDGAWVGKVLTGACETPAPSDDER